MKKLIILAVVLTAFYACSDHNFEIEGKITNAQNSVVYLEKLDVNKTSLVDSSKIDKNGMFRFKGSVDMPTFFLLKLDERKFVTLLVDSTDQIQFSADNISFSTDYSISGSPGSEKVKRLNDYLFRTNKAIDSIQSLISITPKNSQYNEKEKAWRNEIQEYYINQQDFTKQFVSDNPFSMASVLAVYQKFNNGEYVLQDLQTLKMVASALYSIYPGSGHAQSLYRETDQLVKQVKKSQLTELVKEFEVNSPEIVLPDVKGNDVALSSFRGKYVLVHFWSALDRGSRILNEVLVENYQQFNRKGFEIYQVSIDESREAWLRAIELDKLNWTNVGDMSGSVVATSNYNITSIPSNYLLDPEGNIIAKNLQGPALYQMLNEILN